MSKTCGSIRLVKGTKKSCMQENDSSWECFQIWQSIWHSKKHQRNSGNGDGIVMFFCTSWNWFRSLKSQIILFFVFLSRSFPRVLYPNFMQYFMFLQMFCGSNTIHCTMLPGSEAQPLARYNILSVTALWKVTWNHHLNRLYLCWCILFLLSYRVPESQKLFYRVGIQQVFSCN